MKNLSGKGFSHRLDKTEAYMPGKFVRMMRITRVKTYALAAILAMSGPYMAWAQAGLSPDRVQIGTFALDRTEVSVAQFRAFVTSRNIRTNAESEGGGYEFAGGWTRRAGWNWATPFGTQAADNEPAVHVSWQEARDYCAFAGGRLPTFAEWRQAAYTETRPSPPDGFTTGRTYTYPVGERPDGMNNNRRRHVPVGTSKAGVNGLFDMGANVWEWVADRRGNEALTAGGSWWYGPENSKADAAQWKAASFFAVYVGFRCAYDVAARS